MKRFLNIILAALLAIIVGCATPSSDSARISGPMETCHVCKYNNDLACVCVSVKETTPRTDHQGTTYYFCSKDCQKAFLKNPQKYLPKAQKP